MNPMLNIYNSLSQQKEQFKPIKTDHVSLYVCGMTVYDYCHIGHARIFIAYDAFVKFLGYLGYKVTYVRNITDLDDKIIKRAEENKESFVDLTERFIKAMHDDEAALGVQQPDHEPRATEYVYQMTQLIQKLQLKDYAYVAKNGDVCFRVRNFHDYGKLSNRNLDELQVGARIEADEGKDDPLDFVLWKLAKEGEPSWRSPWGKGRPGWHIECSTMSSDLLGQPFDIHGGGIDLKFPHHENELAQSEAALDCPFVHTWMHVGQVQVNQEKMSKSLGNFISIRDALELYPAEAIRYFMLAGHYHSPINYSKENLVNAISALSRLYAALRGLPKTEQTSGEDYRLEFESVLRDDFNTPQALSVLFEMAREINRLRDQNQLEAAAALGNRLKSLGGVLGFLQAAPDSFLQGQVNNSAEIEDLIQQRFAARQVKNWVKADEIRQKIDAMGISIEDTPQGTLWRKNSSS